MVTLCIMLNGIVYNLVIAPHEPAITSHENAGIFSLGNTLVHTVLPLAVFLHYLIFDRRETSGGRTHSVHLHSLRVSSVCLDLQFFGAISWLTCSLFSP